MSKPKIIAYYLPQFHPTPDNDKWWGKGYTEWTNVAKAKPLFKGHYQPKIPADLGFYDLRLPEVREAQAQLAKEAGIYGFCYWSYWFGNGKEELELPFNEVLASGKPNFPFMLCWANESWHSKFWNKDSTVKTVTLLEQLYPGKDDIERYFYHRLPAFKDQRYIKVGNKPVFMIYEWADYENVSEFISIWNQLAKKEGFDGIYFIAHVKSSLENTKQTFRKIQELGFDAINTVRLWSSWLDLNLFHRKLKSALYYIFGRPRTLDFRYISKFFFKPEDKLESIFPTLVPNWDHSPRSGNRGVILTNSTPDAFKEHAFNVLSEVKDKSGPNFVFIRAWNEWGEGNYMEPDQKYGKGYIEALRAVVDTL